MQDNFYEKNIEALNKYHPREAKKIGRASASAISTSLSNNQFPVPLLNGTSLHSSDDPVAEGEQLAQSWLSGVTQERIFVFGFGYGYHIFPLVNEGFSPVIYEPNPEVIQAAFNNIDFTEVLPKITIVTGNMLPDITRMAVLAGLPAYQQLFPALWTALQQRADLSYPGEKGEPANIFQGTFYNSYKNVTMVRNPCDLAAYQTLFSLIRPTLLLEIGAYRGGSALYYADFLRALHGEGHFEIHTFDITDNVAPELLDDPNITFYSRGWTEFRPEIVKGFDRVLVIEDSSHTYENTRDVLETFAPHVTANSYLIVEDGISSFTHPEFNGGPYRAVEEFLPKHPEFEVDLRWEQMFGYGNSNCVKGFLRRKRNSEMGVARN